MVLLSRGGGNRYYGAATFGTSTATITTMTTRKKAAGKQFLRRHQTHQQPKQERVPWVAIPNKNCHSVSVIGSTRRRTSSYTTRRISSFSTGASSSISSSSSLSFVEGRGGGTSRGRGRADFGTVHDDDENDADNDFIKIVEVGPRDGLQNEIMMINTTDKIRFISMLADAGCSHIEAGSFVSPKWVPHMSNSIDVMNGLYEERKKWAKPVVLSCLVPNMRGLKVVTNDALGVDEIAIFASASEAFSQKNINCSISESMERFQLVVDEAHRLHIPIRGYISCVIACPYDGPTSPINVAKVTEHMISKLGCHEVSLGDTIGVGTPATTSNMLKEVIGAVGNNRDSGSNSSPSSLAVHFHDTYGQALANILVSLEYDIKTIDSSVAGLGGCPYAKGASGNVATEDVIYMLNGLGLQTGIDINKLVHAADFICSKLGRMSRSKAGTAIKAATAKS